MESGKCGAAEAICLAALVSLVTWLGEEFQLLFFHRGRTQDICTCCFSGRLKSYIKKMKADIVYLEKKKKSILNLPD